MAYNYYNTRNSGRFNTPGRFVSGGELAPGGPVGGGTRVKQNYNSPNNQRLNQQQASAPSPNLRPVQAPPPPPQQQLTPDMQHQLLENLDEEMKCEASEATKETSEPRPHWMKSKLVGVKKVSNKERRRRQNETLRRLLAPKNALMVLNEMLPGAPREALQFKVEPAQNQFQHSGNTPTFCAELHVDGTDYKGYGDNKVAARNDAAEQAIRDLIIKRITKANSVEANPPTEGAEAEAEVKAEAEAEEGAGAGEAPLPMIQLASFALHKLFAEWECDGHKVPHFKPPPAPQLRDDVSEASGGGGGGGGATRTKAARVLPAGAAAMHPCMLLTYMRPHLEYRELAVDGDRPQNILFTMGVDVDGVTYIGKASNKREARKLAARAACSALYGVQFDDAPANTANTPANTANISANTSANTTANNSEAESNQL